MGIWACIFFGTMSWRPLISSSLPLASCLLLLHFPTSDGFSNFASIQVPTQGFRGRTSRRYPSKWFPLFLSDETSNAASTISEWLVENLETSNPSDASSVSGSITLVSESKAGENDTLPPDGIVIGNRLRILPAGATADADMDLEGIRNIRLLVGRNGWGTGVHPTTRLCLEWLCQTIQPENYRYNDGDADDDDDDDEDDRPVVLDYGCGFGILSIAALHLGASHVIGVDVEAEALVTAERNVQLNGYSTSMASTMMTTTTTTDANTEDSSSWEESAASTPDFRAYHVREMEPESGSGGFVDICVANILIGQLVRPSMVAVLVSYVKPGGFLCLSGIRPSEIPSLQKAYDAYMVWVDQEELSASETVGSVESYGYDVGRWARLVGIRKVKKLDVQDMSEMAVL